MVAGANLPRPSREIPLVRGNMFYTDEGSRGHAFDIDDPANYQVAEPEPEEEITYSAQVPKQLIRNWNNRRLASAQDLTGLAPFVQLIGIYNEAEFDVMFGNKNPEGTGLKPVHFVEDVPRVLSGLRFTEERVMTLPNANPDVDTEGVGAQSKEFGTSWEKFSNEIKDRFINLYLYEAKGNEAKESFISQSAPVTGIMLAEGHGGTRIRYNDQLDGKATHNTQTKEFKGGVGITDLQVDYGQHSNLTEKKYNVRITLNDPAYINDRPEYTKLATMHGEFILIYGWSNPQIIPGFVGTPPPVIMPDRTNDQMNMMAIGLDGIDTGGMWYAAKVAIRNYDFSFNEMGQLEINVTLQNDTGKNMHQVKVDGLAPAFHAIMSAGEYDPSIHTGRKPGDFTEAAITLPSGQTVPLPQLIANGQAALWTPQGSNPTGIKPPGIETLYDRRAQTVIEAMSEVHADDGGFSSDRGEYNQEAYWNEVKKREQAAFPWGGPGIRSFEEITVLKPAAADGIVIDGDDDEGAAENPDPDAAVEMEEVTTFRVKIVYYYLGWVLEALRLSLNNQNRSRVANNQMPFNPKFKYMKNENDSQLKTAFQEKVKGANRGGTMSERLQTAVIRLKEKCLPPFRARGFKGEVKSHTIVARDGSTKVEWSTEPPYRGDDPFAIQQTMEGKNPILEKATPCGGQIIISTTQDKDVRKVIYRCFPTPEGSRNIILPMRGHMVTLDFRSGAPAIASQTSTILALTPTEVRDLAYDDISTVNPAQPAREPGNALDQFAAALRGGEGEEDLTSLARQMGDKYGPIRFFKPDWFIEEKTVIDENGHQIVIPTGGSPEGFDPTNPTAYRAKQRGGKFFFSIRYTWLIPAEGGRRNRTAQTRKKTFAVMDVDEYRRGSSQIWRLTQQRWYNLHVTWLGNYFEQLMKDRLAELEAEGKTVEDIYHEPVDLDFLTGKIYNNWRFSTGSERNGPRFAPKTWQQIESTNLVHGELEETVRKGEAHLIKLKEDLSTEMTDLEKYRTAISSNSVASTALKETIETLTGGRYERANEVGGEHSFLHNFRNWKEMARGAAVDESTGLYTPVITVLEAEYGTPEVSLDWVLWKEHRVPTDSFLASDHDNDGDGLLTLHSPEPTTEEVEGRVKIVPSLPIQASAEDEFPRVIRVSNFQSTWKTEHPQALIGATNLQRQWERYVNSNLRKSSILDNKIKGDRDKYLDIQLNITAYEGQIAELERNLSRWSKFVNEEGQAVELSLYDDTSDFDDVLEIDMGRAQPMRLTTKVAQQWYLRFSAITLSGAGDVRNYGPRPGGTKYFRPSKFRSWQLDAGKGGRRDDEIVGLPRMVIDPELVADIGDRQIRLKPQDEGAASWRSFGNPGVPNLDGANQWGYKPGPVDIDEDGNNIGGNHVANYDEFLALFGLSPGEVFDGGFHAGRGTHEDELGGIGDHDGNWPRPIFDDPPYYMVDDNNNICREGTDLNEGWYQQSGWHLGYGGDPVWLYPKAENAVRVDPITGQVLSKGNKNTSRARVDGAQTDRQNQDYSIGEDSDNRRWRGGTYRIAAGEHNINLTLDEKRALVMQKFYIEHKDIDSRTSAWGGRGSTRHKHRTLGTDTPARAPAGTEIVDSARLGKLIDKPGGGKIYENGVYDTDASGNKIGPPIGPTKLRTTSYTNPEYPYGTGWYNPHSGDPGPYGARQGPERNPNKNYLYIGDFLTTLPGNGMFTTVNNDDYSPSFIDPDGSIVDGKELNIGFVKFVVGNLLAMLPLNRRIGARDYQSATPKGSLKVTNVKDGEMDDKWRISDVTYGHLFLPEGEETDDGGGIIKTFTNFAMKNIQSVADIPIRRDVVDNVINKNNGNVSMAQALQQILHPSAIGVNTGNVNIGIRQTKGDVYEVYQANKNYKAKADKERQETNRSLFDLKYPSDVFLIDYKQSDSLIQNIDMNSQFDPNAAHAFKRGAEKMLGNPQIFAQFMAYGNIAQEFKEFLSEEDKIRSMADPNSPGLYDGVITIGKGGAGETAAVKIKHAAFFGEGENVLVPESLISKFLSQNQETMMRLNAQLEAAQGADFASQLLANYMRQCNVTIHGTTNLNVGDNMTISGVLDNQDGLYEIIAIRESITPQNFTTFIQGILTVPAPGRYGDTKTETAPDLNSLTVGTEG